MTNLSTKTLLAASLLASMTLAGCGGGGGGGSSKEVGRVDPNAATVQDTRTGAQTFASAASGCDWDWDKAKLNASLEADPEVSENGTIKRVKSSVRYGTAIKYADGSEEDVVVDDSGAKVGQPIVIQYGKTILKGYLIDPDGNPQGWSVVANWKATKGKEAGTILANSNFVTKKDEQTGWLTLPDSAFAKTWTLRFTVTSGPGMGRTFDVDAKYAPNFGTASGSYDQQNDFGYVVNSTQVTIALQKDVSQAERDELAKYFDLTNPSNNYLGGSGYEVANLSGINPFTDAHLVNGKNVNATYALVSSGNGAVLKRNQTVYGGFGKLGADLISGGTVLVIKYPNRLVATLHIGGYSKIVESVTTADYDGMSWGSNTGNGLSGSTNC